MSEGQPNTLTNWDRWGNEDQRGTLNLLNPDLVKEAADLIKTGRIYSLSVPLETEGPQWPQRPKMWRVTSYFNDETGSGFSGDALMMHSHSGTHIDALCHCWYDRKQYNGFSATEHVTSFGVTRNAIDNVPFIVGRAVLLDVATWKGVDHLNLGEQISASDLDKCAEAQATVVQAGDILLVRTGWMQLFSIDRKLFDSGEPGIDESTIPWLRERDIVAVGSDNHAVEVLSEIPPNELPVHMAAIRDLGVYLIENLDLEALASDKVYESFFIAAPLRLTGGTGSPINPIAIT